MVSSEVQNLPRKLKISSTEWSRTLVDSAPLGLVIKSYDNSTEFSVYA
jgi:hypothetical protein